MSDYVLKYNKERLDIASEKNYTIPENIHEKVNQLSIVAEPNVKYYEYDNYISISSSNRDNVNYPLHYDYRINFDYPYKNIRKIEMISAILPNQPASQSSGDILNESHLIIDIPGINYIEFPNNIGSKALGAFSILPLKPPTKSSGGFINPELGCIYHKAKVFKTPLASMDSITIRVRSNNGDLYDFGQPSGSTSKEFQNHFVFKITTEETKRTMINHRNVF